MSQIILTTYSPAYYTGPRGIGMTVDLWGSLVLIFLASIKSRKGKEVWFSHPPSPYIEMFGQLSSLTAASNTFSQRGCLRQTIGVGYALVDHLDLAQTSCCLVCLDSTKFEHGVSTLTWQAYSTPGSRCGLVRTSSVFTASYSNITEIYLQIYVIMEFEV